MLFNFENCFLIPEAVESKPILLFVRGNTPMQSIECIDRRKNLLNIIT